MNLRVDLILETERRSGSVVSSKGVVRIISVIVPLLLVGYLGAQFLWANQLRQDLEGLQQSLESAKPQQERAKALIAEFKSHKDIGQELKGWELTRVNWSDQLQGLMQIVPPNVQLSDLRVSQSIQLSKIEHPARLFALTLKGKAVGDDAERSVKRLENALQIEPVFTGLVQRVSIPVYGADTSPDAKRGDRVFAIACECNLREFP
ncbi:MAG: hypothetical protein O3B24_03860 [Verrucomicrobia bacterium]|nr:hypothetical protein [Verrucomicrobiota bacterium]